MIYFEPRHIDVLALLPASQEAGGDATLTIHVAHIRQHVGAALVAPSATQDVSHGRVEVAPRVRRWAWVSMIQRAFASMPSGGPELRHRGMVGAIRDQSEG